MVQLFTGTFQIIITKILNMKKLLITLYKVFTIVTNKFH